ncbi:MAG: hypothetical protein CL678_10080 [Bdellovibrionaceae bacterium]|nr:hypothetical protein [Pseudobdellovibrionaceae bacterium]|tara:strand:- start:4484 stop:5035 length:552 start_codon:yes stop_codon:yes gene_type:complete
MKFSFWCILLNLICTPSYSQRLIHPEESKPDPITDLIWSAIQANRKAMTSELSQCMVFTPVKDQSTIKSYQVPCSYVQEGNEAALAFIKQKQVYTDLNKEMSLWQTHEEKMKWLHLGLELEKAMDEKKYIRALELENQMLEITAHAVDRYWNQSKMSQNKNQKSVDSKEHQKTKSKIFSQPAL